MYFIFYQFGETFNICFSTTQKLDIFMMSIQNIMKQCCTKANEKPKFAEFLPLCFISGVQNFLVIFSKYANLVIF